MSDTHMGSRASADNGHMGSMVSADDSHMGSMISAVGTGAAAAAAVSGKDTGSQKEGEEDSSTEGEDDAAAAAAVTAALGSKEAAEEAMPAAARAPHGMEAAAGAASTRGLCGKEPQQGGAREVTAAEAFADAVKVVAKEIRLAVQAMVVAATACTFAVAAVAICFIFSPVLKDWLLVQQGCRAP